MAKWPLDWIFNAFTAFHLLKAYTVFVCTYVYHIPRYHSGLLSHPTTVWCFFLWPLLHARNWRLGPMARSRNSVLVECCCKLVARFWSRAGWTMLHRSFNCANGRGCIRQGMLQKVLSWERVRLCRGSVIGNWLSRLKWKGGLLLHTHPPLCHALVSGFYEEVIENSSPVHTPENVRVWE